MTCPACNTDLHTAKADRRRKGVAGVLDCRPASDNAIRRRRVCWSCGHRFSTLEVVVVETNGSTPLRLPGAATREQLLGLADRATEMAEAIRSELNEQTVLSL
jgi:hypothetical protein